MIQEALEVMAQPPGSDRKTQDLRPAQSRVSWVTGQAAMLGGQRLLAGLMSSVETQDAELSVIGQDRCTDPSRGPVVCVWTQTTVGLRAAPIYMEPCWSWAPGVGMELGSSYQEAGDT